MRQPAFWLAVAGVSILATPLLHLAADSRLGEAIPGFRDLDSYISRRNG